MINVILSNSTTCHHFNRTYLGKDYAERRDFILQLLKEYGFHISFKPQGSVFVFAELPKSWQISDVSFLLHTELLLKYEIINEKIPLLSDNSTMWSKQLLIKLGGKARYYCTGTWFALLVTLVPLKTN